MPAVTLHTTPFTATIRDIDTGLIMPQNVSYDQPQKRGEVHLAANSTETVVLRSAAKRRAWKLEWRHVGEVTRAAVEAIFDLNQTFTFVHFNGQSYTVQCLPDAYEETLDDDYTIQTSSGPKYRYTITLKIRER